MHRYYSASLLLLGQLVQSGRLGAARYEEAAEWLSRAVQAGSKAAQIHLALNMLNAEGSRRDEAGGYRLLRQLAQQGDVRAQTVLGRRLVQSSSSQPAEVIEGINYLRSAAQGGDPAAAYTLGCLYTQGGPGVASDAQQALAFFMLAAEGGHAEAQTAAGALLAGGEEGDLPRALRYLTLACNQHHTPAALMLVMATSMAPAPLRNWPLALQFLRNAAEAGDLPSMYHLGNLLCNGRTTAEGQRVVLEQPELINPSLGITFLFKALEEGFLAAANPLGLLFLHGSPCGTIAADLARAHSLFQLLIDHGQVLNAAHFNLALCLKQEGQVNAARHHFQIAADLGVVAAQQELQLLSNESS